MSTSESNTIPPSKVCPKCGEEKLHSEFSRDARRKDELQCYCKTCNAGYHVANTRKIRERVRLYRIEHPEKDAAYRENNAEKIAAYNHDYRVANAEKLAAYNRDYYAANREMEIARSRDYRAENSPNGAVYQRAYRAENPEKIAAYRAANAEKRASYMRAYRATNPDRFAANRRNRRARERGNGGTHTAEDVREQYKRQKGKCFYCGVKVGTDYHTDHVIPVALDGWNGPENLVIACPTCNQSKGAKHAMDFCGRLF